MSRNVEEPEWIRFEPLDMWCSFCGVSPGCRCVWRRADGLVLSRQPHGDRVTDARLATARARRRALGVRPGWSEPPPRAGPSS